MFTGTSTSIDFTKNSTESFLKSYGTKSSDKSSSELYKFDNSKSTYKSEDFKKVLNSKSNSREQEDTQKIDNTNQNVDSTEVKDTDKVDELKEKLKELEKKSKSSSKDDVNDTLKELLNLLAKLGVKEEDLKLNGMDNSNLNSTMEKIMELLKNDSVTDKLDTDSLKTMEKLLGNLSNLSGDNTESTKGIKSLMSQISDMLNNKQNQTDKVLTLEDVLNTKYSQDNSESSAGNENNNTSTSKDGKEISKEDKFLNSLVDDNKDSDLSKINLFASRTAAIQNQGVNSVSRGLTVNKATFVDDLIKDVKFMNNNSLKELTVTVNPGNLGEITIKLVQEDGIMKADLKANSKETTALLSQNLSDIKKQLNEQNIKVSDVNIELYQGDTTFFKDQGFKGQLSGEQQRNNSNSSSDTASGAVAAEDEVINIVSNDNNLDLFA
jgi:flagellar hook-length control protein FliK